MNQSINQETPPACKMPFFFNAIPLRHDFNYRRFHRPDSYKETETTEKLHGESDLESCVLVSTASLAGSIEEGGGGGERREGSFGACSVDAVCGGGG